ncbi:MAG: undecaprenyl-diphosphate phosphatase [Alphaproteobacteria bacterium]|nr:undecaprenyl-diphosphate phosphatase [Alphaproteobacteria bacterium]
MSLLQIIVLALIQGITEYLPISSSGHDILVPALTGWPDQGVLTDAITNLGTVSATIIYFWRDVVSMFYGLFDLIKRQSTAASKLVLNVIIASIPVMILGLILQVTRWDEALRSPLVIAINSIVFGLALYAADAYGMNRNRVSDITPKTALLYGLAQMLALNPGTSRSGITMTAGRALGFLRSDAARFSFLISIPANLAGSAVKIGHAIKNHEPIRGDMILSGVLTFFVGLLTVAFLMRLIRSHSFLPFVIYRVMLGGALLGLIYSGFTFGKLN